MVAAIGFLDTISKHSCRAEDMWLMLSEPQKLAFKGIKENRYNFISKERKAGATALLSIYAASVLLLSETAQDILILSCNNGSASSIKGDIVKILKNFSSNADISSDYSFRYKNHRCCSHVYSERHLCPPHLGILIIDDISLCSHKEEDFDWITRAGKAIITSNCNIGLKGYDSLFNKTFL